MLNVTSGGLGSPNCQGFSRRAALKTGVLGAFGFSTADLLKLQAAGKTNGITNKSVILIWLDGGPSQLETYDPKPGAPSEYRGPWGDMKTNVPGIRISNMLPEHAKHADKMCFLRSVHHDNGDHFAAAHWMLTGRFGSTSADKMQKSPSLGSVVSRVAGPKVPGLPPYIGLPAAESVYLYPGYQGAAYLGGAHGPFQVNLQQKYLGCNYKTDIKTPPFLGSIDSLSSRVSDRASLLKQLDGINRKIDQTGAMETMDKHQQAAIDMIVGSNARDAFDMEKEDSKTRDRYGRGPWGHYTLMARRLVESGARFVTVDMPHWDTHSKIKEGLEIRLPYLDMAVGALMQDLADRSMLDDVLVVVMGEFGRTPKLNKGQPGIPIPGRDHWGNAMSVLLAGGGLRGGQVVGTTDSKAEYPIDRPLKPSDVLATIYHVLGINPKLTFPDLTGRPIYLLDDGKPITEII